MKIKSQILLFVSAVAIFCGQAAAQQQPQRAKFDVTNYVIDAQLSPAEHRLSATTDVTFTLLEDTRTVAFELNGSLKADSVARISAAAAAPTTPAAGGKGRTPKPAATPAGPSVTFIQDQVGLTDLGPSVRVDLGETLPKGTSVTLRFKYSGVLDTPSGGPLLTKRLAAVLENNGYLMYAARWFPFNDYASDRATSDITLTVPGGLQVVGFSDLPVTASGGRYRFVQNQPSLPGNFAYGKYMNRNLTSNGYEINFYARNMIDQHVIDYGETIGKALDFYTKRFGNAQFGKRFFVVEIDDESLDYYSSQGMLFISARQFELANDVTEERIQRETASQWWGLTVGLRSFDDAWLSQGLSEYSAYSLRESQVDGAKLEDLRRELLERSLTFEQTASLIRAPANLDDQSTAYQYIMYAKGAFVYKLLRDTIGEEKFNTLLRTLLAEYRGKNISIDEFEDLAERVSGKDLRYFFARWVEGTGVPEFTADYLIIRTRGGKFIARGTVKQNYDNLRLPVDVQLRSEGDGGLKTVTIRMEESSADFNIESDGKPIAVVIDPSYKLLRTSSDLRVAATARRGIEQYREGNYVEAQKQFEEALKLDRSNSWIYYHLGLLYLEQRNYDVAIDNFKATLAGDLKPAWLAVWANIKMGNAYDAKGDRARAIDAYKKAQNLNDDYDNAQDAVKRYQATPYDPRDKQTTAVR